MDAWLNPPLVTGLLFGAFLGAILQRSRFCARSALKQAFDRGDNLALRRFLTAMLVALVVTTASTTLLDIDLTDASYLRDATPLWGMTIGGIVFGVGMMLSRGCPSRLLVKFAEGDLSALGTWLVFVLVVMATVDGVLAPLRTLLTGPLLQMPVRSLFDVADISAPWITLAVALPLLFWLLRQKATPLPLLARLPPSGAVIGFCIALSWYFSIAVTDEFDIPTPTALSFIAPAQELLRAVTLGTLGFSLKFPGATILGVMFGAFLSARVTERFTARVPAPADTSNPLLTTGRSERLSPHLILGGGLMGFGGVLAQGCTFGHGLSGFSVLSLSSLWGIGMISLGAWLGSVLERHWLSTGD